MCLTQQIKAYLIDLCYMSLNQLELALKKTSKLRTPVSIYQFDPIWTVYEK